MEVMEAGGGDGGWWRLLSALCWRAAAPSAASPLHPLGCVGISDG